MAGKPGEMIDLNYYKINFLDMQRQQMLHYADAFLCRQDLLRPNLPNLLVDFAEEMYGHLMKELAIRSESEFNLKMLENLTKPITVSKESLELLKFAQVSSEYLSGVNQKDFQKVEKETYERPTA